MHSHTIKQVALLLMLGNGFVACSNEPAASVNNDAEASVAKLSSGQIYRVISVNSSLALDVVGISTADGAPVQQWSYWNALNQRWQFSPNSDGTYQMISVNSGKCLDVAGASKAEGTHLQQWDCNGGANQAWKAVLVGNSAYELVSVNSGLALDVIGVSKDGGALLQQWPYWGGANQQWLIQPVDGAGNPTGGAGPTPTGAVSSSTPTPTPTSPTTTVSAFGNMPLHPEKIGFYMVPDLQSPYTATNNSPAGWCAWTQTQASLNKLHALMPSTIVRWDNETGHNTDSTGNVETFVSCANNAGVHMIVTASAIDGYNNWWANGSKTPNASLVDFANGPYLSFANHLLTTYPVVQLVETANEPDGPWFNSDGDNASDFDYYMSKLTNAMGSNASRIVGPSAAIRGSNIWNDFTARGDMSNVSYHTYGSAGSLFDVSGKNVYVTEYGGYNLDPGAVLADLWQAEHQNKLSGSIAALFYVQLTDNGSNRGAFNQNTSENGHFAFRDWFRALTLYQAVAEAGGKKGYVDANNADFVAADNGGGGFASLHWNNSGGSVSVSRSVPATSLAARTQLYVLHLTQGDSNVAVCQPIAAQSKLSVQVNSGNVTLNISGLEPHAAILVSTLPCDSLAN